MLEKERLNLSMANYLFYLLVIYLGCLAYDLLVIAINLPKLLDGRALVPGLATLTSVGGLLESHLDALKLRLNSVDWQIGRIDKSLNLPNVAQDTVSPGLGNVGETAHDAFFKSVLSTVGREFRADHMALLIFSHNNFEGVIIESHKQEILKASLLRFIKPFIRSGECFGLIDIQSVPFHTSGLSRYGVRYSVCFPFTPAEDGSIGALWLGYGADKPPTELEVRWAEELCGKIERELKASKRIFELSGKVLEFESLDRSKTEFMLHLSHDIRSPLNNIKAVLSLLEAQGLDSETSDIIDAARRNCDSVADMVQDLLDYARHQAGKLGSRRERVELLGLVKGIMHEFEAGARLKDLSLTLTADEGELYAWIDRRQIKRVIGNLVSNAIKYTNRGRVDVRVSRDIEGILVTVEDSGSGMSSEQVSRLFTPFTRFNGGVDGIGLGLALSRILAEVNEGALSATSVEGQGSRFMLRVPEVSAAETKDIKAA